MSMGNARMSAIGRATTVRCAARALYYSRLLRPLSMLAGYVSREPTFAILKYHRVNDARDPFFPSVPTAVFERQMAYIARTFRVLTVEELAERSRRGSVPRNALAITFDDGYRDCLTHAAPILVRHGLPATLFLTTGFIGTAEAPWFDQVAMAFKATRATSVVAPWGGPLDLGSRVDRLAAMERTLGYFKRLSDNVLRRHFDQLLGALAVTDRTWFKDLMLGWDDVQTLVRSGIAIGAHTVTHPVLSRVSPERASAEIVGSRTMIKSACGFVPKAFAYPNGRPEDYTDAVMRLVVEAGFTCAVTTRFGLNTSETPPYELRRGGPWEEDLATFALKLAVYRVLAR
jgi:peptidoglycan/xylan/chitin deacetylase (PgdA/CDA1 family)